MLRESVPEARSGDQERTDHDELTDVFDGRRAVTMKPNYGDSGLGHPLKNGAHQRGSVAFTAQVSLPYNITHWTYVLYSFHFALRSFSCC